MGVGSNSQLGVAGLPLIYSGQHYNYEFIKALAYNYWFVIVEHSLSLEKNNSERQKDCRLLAVYVGGADSVVSAHFR